VPAEPPAGRSTSTAVPAGHDTFRGDQCSLSDWALPAGLRFTAPTGTDRDFDTRPPEPPGDAAAGGADADR